MTDTHQRIFEINVNLEAIKKQKYPLNYDTDEFGYPLKGCISITPKHKIIEVYGNTTPGFPPVVYGLVFEIDIPGTISGEELYNVLTDDKFTRMVNELLATWEQGFDGHNVVGIYNRELFIDLNRYVDSLTEPMYIE